MADPDETSSTVTKTKKVVRKLVRPPLDLGVGQTHATVLQSGKVRSRQRLSFEELLKPPSAFGARSHESKFRMRSSHSTAATEDGVRQAPPRAHADPSAAAKIGLRMEDAE